MKVELGCRKLTFYGVFNMLGYDGGLLGDNVGLHKTRSIIVFSNNGFTCIKILALN
jgi:hypothetical protein